MSNFEEGFLHALAENIPHRIYAKDRQGRFTFANHSVAMGMGVDDPSILLGKTDFDFYHEQDAAQYFAEEASIMETGVGMVDKLEHVEYNLKDGDRWLMTTKVPIKDTDGNVIGIAGINHDITNQKRAEQKLIAAEKKAQDANVALQQAMESVEQTNKKVLTNFKESLSLITNVIELQDGSKKNYTNMIVAASVSIAKSLELSSREVEQLRIAALLHNIGKLSLPDDIRKKSMNTLSRNEKEIFKTHPVQGEAVLSDMTGLKTVAKFIRSHCEYINGKGFPDRLIGNKIPIISKILCVTCDFHKLESNLLVDTISQPEQAIEYIRNNSGTLYDARIVELFSQYFAERLQNYRSLVTPLALVKVKRGMVLGEDLISASGLRLLTKQTTINNDHIDQLTKYESETDSELIFAILNSSIDELVQC